jgi:hypothetical protein
MIEKNQNTEQVILQVAKDVFIEKGYAAGKYVLIDRPLRTAA